MKHGIYGVFDFKMLGLVAPIMNVFPTDASAVRFFEEAILDPQSRLGRNPDDYCLIRLGDLDLITSVVDPVPAPLSIPVVTGTQVVLSIRSRSTPPLDKPPMSEANDASSGDRQVTFDDELEAIAAMSSVLADIDAALDVEVTQ